ncbi:MAG TPA: AI-2E family transporter [Candidatus Sulfotelmatobacter sp.]|nr:AI-2E family transporter [Candidatus Sulfotelmatobacter sp.]
MITEFSVEDKTHIARAREVFIRMSLLAIVGICCFLLLRPFLDIMTAGIIIAVGIYPGYQALKKALHGRANWAAVLCTVLLLLVILVPAFLLAGTLVGGIRSVADQLKAGQLRIPSAPPNLDKLPIVGPKLKEFWNFASVDISGAVSRLAPRIKERIPALVSTSVSIGSVLLKFLIAILLAGLLLATSEQRILFADRLFARIFDDQAREFEQLIASTIRSVTNGILGVAVIQSLFASLGFWVIGLPGAGLWAVVFLIGSVLQIGGLVLIPAVLYVFATNSTISAAAFLVWCIIVGLMDNVLKPLLLGRGSTVPMAVIFVGVLGGFITMNIIGLFVGAIILSVGYKLLNAWLGAATPNNERSIASGR